MTDKDIMEEISKGYLEVLANRNGYFNAIQRDYGTDLTIRKARICPSRSRYLTTGKAIDIQVKAVSERYVRGLEDPDLLVLKYDLAVKNYNDLVDRANETGKFIPLLLAVFIMPADKTVWVELKPEELVLRKCAYWFQVQPGLIHATASTKKTIEIPKSNRITMDFYDEIFSSLD